MGAYTSFRSFPLFVGWEVQNVKCGDRGPRTEDPQDLIKEEEILEKTPFPLLPNYLYHIRGASNRTEKNFQNKLHNKFARRWACN